MGLYLFKVKEVTGVVQILILYAALDTVHAFLFDKLPESVVAC